MDTVFLCGGSPLGEEHGRLTSLQLYYPGSCISSPLRGAVLGRGRQRTTRWPGRSFRRLGQILYLLRTAAGRAKGGACSNTPTKRSRCCRSSEDVDDVGL